MVSIHALTSEQSWRMLRAIARTHGWPFSAQWRKNVAVAYLTEKLQELLSSQRALHDLLDVEITALLSLRLAGGALPQHRFTEHFGEIRTDLTWRKYDATAPWHQPISIFEHLLYLGYVFRRATPSGCLVELPDELNRLLPQPKLEPVASDVAVGTRVDMLLDMVHFLVYLQGQSVRPLARRWLSPTHFRAVNITLMSPDPTVANARSELQTGYLRFVHFLTEVSGLVEPTMGFLRPAVSAWNWLECSDPQRQTWILESWFQDLERRPVDETLWATYRFAGEPQLAAHLMRLLGAMEPGAYSLDELVRTIRPRCISTDTLPSDGDLVTPLSALLKGPMTWIGWVSCSDDAIITCTSECRQWLDPDAVPDAPKPCAPVSLHVHSDRLLLLTLPKPPVRPPLLPLLNLAPFAPDMPTPVQATLQRVLSQERFAALLSCGYSLDWLANHLSDLTQSPLSPPVASLLAEWARRVRSMRFERMDILTVGDPELLEEALTDRGSRELLDQTLSPHHLAIKPHAADQLLRRLRHKGYTPWVSLAIESQNRSLAISDEDDRSLSLDRGAVAQLWLALRIVVDLSDVTRLPNAPSPGLLSTLGEYLGGDVLSLEALAREAGDRLRDAIDGYGPFPSPLLQADINAVADVLTKALAEQMPVKIIYHTTGRGERTERVVEPLRFEERGGVVYLIAYCRLRQDERVFRLDRIERASPVTA